MFGSTQQQQQPASTSGGLFGSTQPSNTFGGSTLGGGFGTTTTTTPQNTSIFGSTNTGGLGTTTSTGGGLFGSSNQQQTSSPFGAGGLGTGSTLGLGGGLGSFNLTSNTTSTTLGSGLGTGLNLGGGLGGLQTQQQQQQQLQLQQQNAAQSQPLLQQQLNALTQSPYGTTSSLLKSSLQDLKEDILKPISPMAQRPYITEATSPQKTAPITDFKGGLSQPVKLTTKPLSSISLNKKTDLFEGLEDEETPCFLPRKNIKKLLLKPHSENNQINTSRRSSANTSINGDVKTNDYMR